jgi:hypothetical protein
MTITMSAAAAESGTDDVNCHCGDDHRGGGDDESGASRRRSRL